MAEQSTSNLPKTRARKSPLPGAIPLLRRLRDGQEEAAVELYSVYAERIRNLIRSRCGGLLGQRIDPDDVVQSVFRVFVQAVRRGLYDVPDGETLWNLLTVIALNKFRSVSQFHQAAKRDVRATVPLSAAELVADALRPGQVEVVVRDILDQMGAEERQIAQLRLEGYEVAEIASRLTLSKRTVERILQRCRAHLARLLDSEPAA